MRFGWILLLFVFKLSFGQEIVLGSVVSEENFKISNVQVYNISSGSKTISNFQGDFSISAKAGDELRFVKDGYERSSKRISASDLSSHFNVILVKIPMKIEEVEIVKLTGDLSKDARKLTKTDKIAALKRNIGLPEDPEKPREKPAEVVNDILLPLMFANLNVQAIYDVVSGKSRRLKSLYQYEDLQENVTWLKERIEPDFFLSQGLPQEKISEFLEFSLLINPSIKKYIRVKNLMMIQVELDKAMELYKNQEKK